MARALRRTGRRRFVRRKYKKRVFRKRRFKRSFKKRYQRRRYPRGGRRRYRRRRTGPARNQGPKYVTIRISSAFVTKFSQNHKRLMDPTVWLPESDFIPTRTQTDFNSSQQRKLISVHYYVTDIQIQKWVGIPDTADVYTQIDPDPHTTLYFFMDPSVKFWDLGTVSYLDITSNQRPVKLDRNGNCKYHSLFKWYPKCQEATHLSLSAMRTKYPDINTFINSQGPRANRLGSQGVPQRWFRKQCLIWPNLSTLYTIVPSKVVIAYRFCVATKWKCSGFKAHEISIPFQEEVTVLEDSKPTDVYQTTDWLKDAMEQNCAMADDF